MPSFLQLRLKTFLEAVANIRNNKETSLITIFTISVAVAILGLFLLIYFNFNNILSNWSEQLQLIVYLRDDASNKELEDLRELIRNDARIWKWNYLSKDEALLAFSNRLQDKSSILEGLAANPLPASFNIYFKEGYRNYGEIGLLAATFKDTPGVEDVDYGGEWISRFEAAILFLEFFITAVGGLLGMGLTAIISNTIRLSVYSRSDEIEIKKLVGATRWYIQAPFLMEGIIQGLLGVILALLMLFLFYIYFTLNLVSGSQVLMGVSIDFIPGNIIFFMIFAGGLIGGVGSFLALGKFMRFDRSI